MKRNLLALLLIVITVYLAGIFLPWWGPIIPCVIIGVMMNWKIGQAFLWGFIGIFGLYAALTWGIDSANDHILTTRISQLFQNIGNAGLIIISGIIGALIGGVATALGASFRPFFIK